MLFFAWGQRHGSFNLKRAYKCEDREEMEAQLVKVDMPNIKIALTGRGRVAGGAIEILEKLNIKKVSPQDFLNKEFDEPVYTQLSVTDYNKRKEGEGSMSDFFKNPTMLRRELWSIYKGCRHVHRLSLLGSSCTIHSHKGGASSFGQQTPSSC